MEFLTFQNPFVILQNLPTRGLRSPPWTGNTVDALHTPERRSVRRDGAAAGLSQSHRGVARPHVLPIFPPCTLSKLAEPAAPGVPSQSCDQKGKGVLPFCG